MALSESGLPYAKIDTRALYFTHGSIPQEILAKRILSSLISSLPSKGKPRLGIIEALSSIKGLRLSGIQVEFDKKPDLAEILETINSWGERSGRRVLIAFDEAQYLRLSGIQYDGLIAYAVDNLSNITFVLTGSEVGMLHDFLGLDNPKKPLFGRYAREIVLERFTREQSSDFLEKGFEELRINVSSEELERVVDRLDGIVGWLSTYGYLRGVRKLSEKDALEELFRRAEALVMDELSSLISHSRRYWFILKAVSLGNSRWSSIKEYVEFKAGRINDAKFSHLLKNLVKYGYLKKTPKAIQFPIPLSWRSSRSLNLPPGKFLTPRKLFVMYQKNIRERYRFSFQNFSPSHSPFSERPLIT